MGEEVTERPESANAAVAGDGDVPKISQDQRSQTKTNEDTPNLKQEEPATKSDQTESEETKNNVSKLSVTTGSLSFKNAGGAFPKNRERRSSDDGAIMITSHTLGAPPRAPTKTPPSSMPASPVSLKDRTTIDWSSVPSLLQPSSNSQSKGGNTSASSSAAPSPPIQSSSHSRVTVFRNRENSGSTAGGEWYVPLLPESASLKTKLSYELQDFAANGATETQQALPETRGPLHKILAMEQEHPQLPIPKAPAKCPLFCVFYSEFDIKVGPVLCFQSPKRFMDHDIEISTDKIHSILGATFERLSPSQEDSSNNDEDDNDGNLKSSKSAVQEAQSEQNMDGDTPTTKEASTQKEDKSKSMTLKHISSHSRSQDKSQEDLSPDPIISDGSLSIFDSTSEYIITGNELSGKLINLSTHDMHIMTRPTIISDERYERNTLLFSVGFVLRRTADPRPFRPLLSKLALTLRSMEIESKFLSNPQSRTQIQPLLERVLVSLNSNCWECNLLLNKSNALNLKLFHPPKPDVSQILDHEVPILLRKDVQLNMYDWDLAINWVILHIDGVTNARLISIKAEVDMEMVRSCLRVLRYHGVIALVDMFMYSNRYEFTDKATAMLAGKHPKLLQDAVNFVAKRPSILLPSGVGASPILTGSAGPESMGSDTSHNLSVSPHASSPSEFLSSVNRSSYQAHSMSFLASSNKSSNFKFAMMAQSVDRENNLSSLSKKPEEQKQLKAAIGELYCACQRTTSFGDLWVAMTTSTSSNPSTLGSQRTFGPRNSSGGAFQKNNVSRMDSVSETSSGPNTLREQKQRDSLNSENKGSGVFRKNSLESPPFDWSEIFEQFDHRRFVSFGLVHGLIVRVHDFPYFPGHFPGSSVFGNNLLLEDSKKSGLKQQFMQERSHDFARRVASMMVSILFCNNCFACGCTYAID
jgi:hypothetical protein